MSENLKLRIEYPHNGTGRHTFDDSIIEVGLSESDIYRKPVSYDLSRNVASVDLHCSSQEQIDEIVSNLRELKMNVVFYRRIQVKEYHWEKI